MTYVDPKGYVRNNHRELEHRAILSAPSDKWVDHKDGDKQNNDISNLRLCTPSQNAMNRSKLSRPTSSRFKGVYELSDGRTKKWKAQIKINGKWCHCGNFYSEFDAAHAYDLAANLLFGEFAKPNFG